MKFRLREQHAENFESFGFQLHGCNNGIESDAVDVCRRGGAFSHNELTGDGGEFVAFQFDGRKTFQENVDRVLGENPGLQYPSQDAWWSVIKGGIECDETETMKVYYLINPSNRPLEKVEGYGDYRVPVLVFRSKENGYSTEKEGWFLSSLCTDKDGRVQSDAPCLIYFKTKNTSRLFDLKAWFHLFMTGKTYHVGRKKPEEQTGYAKSVIAKMSQLRDDIGVEQVNIRVIDKPLHHDNPAQLPEIERALAKADESGVLTDAMFHKLVVFAASNTVGTWKVIGPNTVAEFHGDFTYSGSGGSSYYSILRLWHNGAMEKRSYRWRDGNSEANDRPDLCIAGVGKTSIDGRMVTIELLSTRGATRGRTEVFTLGEELRELSGKSFGYDEKTPLNSKVGCLQLLHDANSIIIGATNGDETFANAGRIFTGQLHPDFKEWGCGKSSSPTRRTAVQVFEMSTDGTFEDVYRSTAIELDSLWLAESQIIEFVRTHRKWLKARGFATFFLFKQGSEFLVARIQYVSHGYLYARPFRLSHDKVWTAKYRHRFVLPVRK